MTVSKAKSGLEYRPEIDGLRAVAVLSVVLYHYGVSRFPGGFTGVDIFFVISGFLIGGLLWSELKEKGKIKLGDFFWRRIRRLAPAYLAMAVATFIAAWFILLPFDFREFGQDLVASTVYLANVHFFRDSGYFDTSSDQKFLLHTWSLSVEEQFYLFLPVLMLFFASALRALPYILAAVGVVSLIASLVMMGFSPVASFYLFPFRAWELLAGVVMAMYGQIFEFRWQIHAAVSWIGLGLIVLAVVCFSAGDHFPGLYAVVPVLGTMLIIGNGRHDNVINRLLCSRIFLFFGFISYSLYLWHWPIISLLKYYTGESNFDIKATISLGVVTIFVSWLSFKFIETPLRRGGISSRGLLAGYVFCSGIVLTIAMLVSFSNGLPNRFPAEAAPYIAATRDFNQNWSRCEKPSGGQWAGLEICPIGPKGAPKVLVWGDSHGRAFKEGLEEAANEAGTPALLVWRGGCPPLLGVWKNEKVSSAAEEAACARSQELVLRGLDNTPSIESVLLIGRWAYYAEGTGTGIDSDNWIKLGWIGDAEPAPDQRALFAAALKETVVQLGAGGRKVFVLRQMPEISNYSSRAAARDIAYGRFGATQILTTAGRIARKEADARSAPADAALASAFPPERIINLWGRVCNMESCSISLDGTPIYFDNNHVTNTGAIKLREGFGDVFNQKR